MAEFVLHRSGDKNIYVGASSDTLPTDAHDGDERRETDTGNTFEMIGGAWVQTKVGGAIKVAMGNLAPDAVESLSVGATLVAVAAFATENISKLGLQLEVATADLGQLDLYVKYHADGDYIDLGQGINWSAAVYPVLASDITNDAAVAVGTYYIDVNVSAYYSVQFRAASGTTSTVSVYAGGLNG